MSGITVSLCAVLTAMGAAADGPSLTNNYLRVELAATARQVPYIAACRWVDDGSVAFETAGPPAPATWSWLDLASDAGSLRASAGETDTANRVEFRRQVTANVEMTWVVELVKNTAMLRLHVRLRNTGSAPEAVPWFPIWSAQWRTSGAATLKWWKALSYEPIARNVAEGLTVTLGSRLHSSDTRDGDGINPYWQLTGEGGCTFLALEWCGGWEGRFEGTEGRLAFRMRLPEDETQLVLQPGESIDGPVLGVTPTRGSSEADCRRSWMADRARFAEQYYRGPRPGFPFTYNHWYTTRFDLTAKFLRRQVALGKTYPFDFFIIDAGWYEEPGAWVPDPAKFKDDEFENLLAKVRKEGIPTGIWTCPQFVSNPDDPNVDKPGFHEKFIGGYLLDLADCGFTDFLERHVAMLRERYGATWWKYDQVLFAPETRAGVMRNVLAFQDALVAVRRSNPDLYIENCQSGGRMVNELTALATESQWLRDGGRNGWDHARSNIREALGAIEFLPPETANRWTNNPGMMKRSSTELLKAYCRSAMAGTWGLVADLGDIDVKEQATILGEVHEYRRLNALKADHLYDVVYPAEGAPLAGAVFYSADGLHAAVLALRWDRDGAFETRVPLPHLQPERNYRVEDTDTDTEQTLEGGALRGEGLDLRFGKKQLSTLCFIDAAEP